MPKISTTCPECGKDVFYYASWPRKYCSHHCRGLAVGRAKSQHYESTCEGCGAIYRVNPHITRGRFCSLKCHGTWLSEHRRGENHPRFGRKFGRPTALPPPLTKPCERCGTSFITKQSHVTRRRFCSRSCYAAWQSETGANAGPNSGTWRGGYDPYYGPSWRAAMRAVRQRDKVCVDCGTAPNGRELDVHHIVPFRKYGRERHVEANALDNLVALCNVCHLRREPRVA